MSISSTSNSGYYSVWDSLPIKESKKTILKELHKIVEEEKEDKEKYLPLFDPKDLDL